MIAVLAGHTTRHAWKTYTGHFVTHVLDVVRRDPGHRLLIAVMCGIVNHIRYALRQHHEVQLVQYTQL